MKKEEIQFNGDPRKLALAVFRAAFSAFKEKYGYSNDPVQIKRQLELTIPDFARQIVKALDQEVRDVYLMNAIEIMAINYTKQKIKLKPDMTDKTKPLDTPILKIYGKLKNVKTFNHSDLDLLPDQISDISEIFPNRQGEGFWLCGLFRQVKINSDATQATFHSLGSQFSAKIPLSEALTNGLFLYRLKGQPLPKRLGGPLRLLIPGTKDRCINVKSVSKIEITSD